MTQQFWIRTLGWWPVLLIACGPSSARIDQSRAGTDVPTSQMPAGSDANDAAVSPASSSRDGPAQSIAATASSTARKLVRSGTLSIAVNSVQAATRAADSIIKQRGAMLVDSKRSEDADGRHEAELDIRVPSDSFARTITALRELGDVRSEELGTQDITRNYIDRATRLTVKEQEVARLHALLDARTAKLTDVLDVERELTRAVTELEEMKGEQRYYDQQVALSSIQLTLTERTASSGTQIAGPVRDALRSSLGVLGTSLSGIVYLIAIVLPWAIIMLIAWWIATRVRKRMRSSGR